MYPTVAMYNFISYPGELCYIYVSYKLCSYILYHKHAYVHAALKLLVKLKDSNIDNYWIVSEHNYIKLVMAQRNILHSLYTYVHIL